MFCDHLVLRSVLMRASCARAQAVAQVVFVPSWVRAQNEERPAEIVEEPIVNRTEDLLVESGKVTTVVKLESEGVTTEYRRVYHKWGGAAQRHSAGRRRRNRSARGRWRAPRGVVDWA